MSKCTTTNTPLDPEQIDNIVDLTKGNPEQEVHAAALLAAYNGLRPGQIVTLRWQDVNFDNNSVRFVSSKDDRTRTVYMAAVTAEYLRKVRPEREESDKIFNHPLPWLVCHLNLALRKACQKLGLPRINAHGLRRSFICNLANPKK
jgi:integrase